MAKGFEEKWDVQIRKGTLELAVLGALQGRSLYGLELLTSLQGFASLAITEGTLYPLMDRMRREGLVGAEWSVSEGVKPRKYYHLTQDGEEKMRVYASRWRRSISDVEFILNHPGPGPLSQKGSPE